MAKSVDHTVSSSVCFLSYTSLNPLNPKSSKTFLSLPLFFCLKTTTLLVISQVWRTFMLSTFSHINSQQSCVSLDFHLGLIDLHLDFALVLVKKAKTRSLVLYSGKGKALRIIKDKRKQFKKPSGVNCSPEQHTSYLRDNNSVCHASLLSSLCHATVVGPGLADLLSFMMLTKWWCQALSDVNHNFTL